MASSTQINAVLIWLLAGALVAGGAGGAYFYKQRDSANERQVAAAGPKVEAKKAEEPAAKPVEKVAKAEPEAEPEAAMAPQFGLLRVEKDGSAVIAGTVPGSSAVELLANGEVIGKGKAESGGDFAIVLDNPLKAGDYELSIRAIQPDGKAVISQEAGIVSIPNEGGDVIAMIAREGEASQIIQKPEARKDASAGETVKVEELAKPEAPKAGAGRKTEPVPEVKFEANIGPKIKPGIEAAPVRQVLVEAVDVDSGKIFVAGTGEPGRKANIYLDNAFLGTAEIGATGTYLLESVGEMAEGLHQIRADLLSPDGAAVANRAEVPLIHEVSVTAKAAESAPKVAEGPKVEEVAPKVAEAPKVEEAAPKVAEAPKVEEIAAKVEETANIAEFIQIAVEPLRTGASVIIRRGDNLWRVSRRMLGRGIQYTVIYDANRDQIRNPRLIYPGQVFAVPGGQTGADNG